MKNLEKQIINDITRKRKLVQEIKETNPQDLLLHFGVGGYIRDKYLWQCPQNVKKLSMLYGTDNIDDISHCLVKKIYFKITGQELKDDF